MSIMLLLLSSTSVFSSLRSLGGGDSTEKSSGLLSKVDRWLEQGYSVNCPSSELTVDTDCMEMTDIRFLVRIGRRIVLKCKISLINGSISS